MGRTRSRSASRVPASPPPSRTGIAGRWALALGIVAALLVAAGLAVFIGGSRDGAARPGPLASPQPPDILLITLDTTRADRLGSYGYSGAATANLDRLARDGVRFDRALSPVPLTLPAHASVLTGRDPFRHGVRNNGHFVLPADVPTIAEGLTARGYDTAAFVSSFVLDRQFGLARGFSHYDDGLDEATGGPFVSLELERRGDRTAAAARAWLAGAARQGGSRPYFLWVHLYDAHEPYAPPSPFREQFTGRPYDGEVAFQDAVVGSILDAAGYGSATSPLVVVAGDHGESLGDHGESTHGLFVYDAALRVPLIVAWPGRLRAASVSTPVRLIDIAPTLMDIAAGAIEEGMDGRTLRTLLEGGHEADEPPPVYAETYFPQFFMQWAPLRALHAGRWKYIDAPEPELYDLQADPGERTNLASQEATRLATMRRVLEGMMGAGAGRQASTPLSSDAQQRLSSLGYLSAAPPPAASPSTLPDPKRMLPLYEQLLDGNRELGRGDAERAARRAREVLAQDPANAFARLLLGRAALAAGRHREAIDALRAYAAAVPGSADAHHWMAVAHLRLGDRVRALAEEEATLAIDPRHTAAISLRAGLLFSTGRRDEGIASLEEAVKQEPSNQTLALELADLLADAKRFGEAEPIYRRVLSARPRDGRALTGLGLLLSATGRLEPALEPLTRALDVEERDDEARLARAAAYAKLGRVQEARADYERLAKTAARPDLRQLAAEGLAAIK
jgi:choline-sulfatase